MIDRSDEICVRGTFNYNGTEFNKVRIVESREEIFKYDLISSLGEKIRENVTWNAVVSTIDAIMTHEIGR